MPDRMIDRRQGHANDVRELQRDVSDLKVQLASLKVLDQRVTTVESVLREIKDDFEKTMEDISLIKTSIAETNLLRTWVGRIVIGIVSAAVSFYIAKYT